MMTANTTSKVVLGLMSLFLAVGCFFKDDTANENDPRIVEEVRKRVITFRNAKKEECQKRLLERATAKTDSILMERAQFLLQRDSLMVPPRPLRPEKPSLKPEKEVLLSRE